MRARRAGTAAAGQFPPPWARRGWQQSYRCLPRAQPGPERSAGTRPNHAVEAVAVLEAHEEHTMTIASDASDATDAPSRTLTLGFSPCPNDTFIFHALVHGMVGA